MAVGSYKFHRRALAALHQLSNEEQAQVLERLAALVGAPVADWSAPQAKKLPGDPVQYLVRVNDSLRAIVRADGEQEPEVMDIVHQETLKLFSKTAANGQ